MLLLRWLIFQVADWLMKGGHGDDDDDVDIDSETGEYI